jgi:peptidyl-prolyl cis-trans isomerase A (cyclophilin A)
MRKPVRSLVALAAFSILPAAGSLLSGCKSDTPPEPAIRAEDPGRSQPRASATATAVASSAPAIRPAATRRRVTARPVASVEPSADDPLKGKWSLADATGDLKGKGTLLADLEVEYGAKNDNPGTTARLTCALFEAQAPLTVANFVGLARGTRPWKSPGGKWGKKPAYDGTVFHRIIKGFMIQGGDANGTGTGEPGYVIPDEVWDEAYHDRAGLLCMANRGPNTNGAQFFITDAAAPHLDSGYTIFGECSPVDTVHKLASVEVKGEKPASPPKIKRVTIRRGTSPVALPGASASASGAAPGASASAPGATPAP